MHELSIIISRNAIVGDFTRELQETISLYANATTPLTAVEEQVLFLARRLLALKHGAPWNEEPLWKDR